MMSTPSRKPAAAAASSMTCPQQDDPVRHPAQGDIVLGRGNAQAWRHGNKHLHALLDNSNSRYQSALTTTAKRVIIHEIYMNTKTIGRFLQRSEANDGYFEISEREAKEKIGHALRYRNKRKLKPKARPAGQLEDAVQQVTNTTSQGHRIDAVAPSAVSAASPAIPNEYHPFYHTASSSATLGNIDEDQSFFGLGQAVPLPVAVCDASTRQHTSSLPDAIEIIAEEDLKSVLDDPAFPIDANHPSSKRSTF